MEEGATLSRTLFPYLNKVTDYRFLGEETNFIANRFLNSLITHVKDTGTPVELGFVLYAINLNPRSLHGIFKNDKSVNSLSDALRHLKFPRSAIGVMTLFPEKFLWPNLLNSWKSKSSDSISESASILAKMDIIADPGAYMTPLMDVLAQRSLLSKCLQEVDRIRLTLPRLVIVLEKLAPL